METTNEAYQSILKEKETYTQMITDLGDREREYIEKINTLEEVINDKNTLIHQYREECNSWETKYKELQDSFPSDSNISKLLEKLTSKMEENTKAVNQLLAKNNQDTNTCTHSTEIPHDHNSEGSIATYSKVLAMPSTNTHAWQSDSAILLKRRPTTRMTLNYIRNMLNKEFKDMTGLPKIYCETTRDRDTLLIKTETDESTNTLLGKIEKIKSIKDLVDITYKATNTKKIIILGIPSIVSTEELSDRIKELLPANEAKEDLKK